MVYRAIGIMSGSSLDGVDLAFVEFHHTANKWSFDVRASATYPYSAQWIDMLKNSNRLSAYEYQLLHVRFGHYVGEQVNRFIAENDIQYQVQLIASHGHTSFHSPAYHMTAQLGDGAAIAADTGINVVSDLRAMDIALGGHGAPIVPIGERLLFPGYDLFLNIGGIANISYNHPDRYIAFDVCPANRVLNLIAMDAGKSYDDGGQLAAKGEVVESLLEMLDDLEYYRLPFPKSLSNDFGTDVVFPLIDQRNYDVDDALRTYVEHIARQVSASLKELRKDLGKDDDHAVLLVTGGGAHNDFLVGRMRSMLEAQKVSVEIPDRQLVDFKEAIIMAFIGVLRWREEANVLSSVTGASRDSINGAVWLA